MEPGGCRGWLGISSRIRASDHRASRSFACSQATFLNGVIEWIDQMISDAGASVEAGPLPAVLADEVQLQRLFQNLIVNAIEFRSEAPPRISVTAAPNGEI